MENIICHFFIFLVEAFILWQYAFPLFAGKCSIFRRAAALCLLYLILFAVSFSGSKWLNATFYLIINFVFLGVWCCSNWYAAFFHASLLTAVMVSCELMVYYISAYFTPHFQADESVHNLAIFAMFSKLIFFIIVFVLSQFLKGRQDCREPQITSVFLPVLIPAASVFVMFAFIRISDCCIIPSALNVMVTLSAAFLLVINLLMFGINQYEQKKHMEFTQMQLLLQKESDCVQYYKMLLAQNENKSILIHDIKKHLQSIETLNNQGESDKIAAYLRQLMHSSDLQEMSRLCSHELLNAILCRYQRYCTSHQINFHADIRSGTVEFISDADLTSLFCNLLDNAAEAASHMAGSFIEIGTYRREKTPFIVMTVMNSSRRDPFSGQISLSAAVGPDQQEHGFGVKSIRRIVERYDGDMQMRYDRNTQIFHTVIILKRPES